MGIMDIFDRWRLGPGTTGVLFKKETWLALGDGDSGLEFPVPVSLALSSRGKLVVTDLDKLNDSVKEITGRHGWQISVNGTSGNWKAHTLPGLPDIPVVGGMIEQGYGIASAIVGFDEVMQAVPWLGRLAMTILTQEAPIKMTDKEGLLAQLGVGFVVFDPNTLKIQPTANINEWAFSFSCYSDADSEPISSLFPQGEAPGGGE